MSGTNKVGLLIYTFGLQLALIILINTSATADEITDPLWTWECLGGKCQKHPVKEMASNSDGSSGVMVKNVTSFEVCKLLCGDILGSLWPMPTGKTDIEGPAVPIKLETATFDVKSLNGKEIDKELYDELSAHFKEKLANKERSDFRKDYSQYYTLSINGAVKAGYEPFALDTDESYSLVLEPSSSKTLAVKIESSTFFGMRHALETLNQLIVPDYYKKFLVMPERIHITDKPAFPYRALTLDTARNFISVKSIKRTLDGMAANKLNIFHWHITDTHSFPFVSKSLPQLSAYGAYSPEKTYKPSDIKEIIQYAKIRGIKVIPEFDAPAHVGEGWQWSPPGTVLCLNEQPWNMFCVEPPCGQLNPTKEHLYDTILPKLYKDMIHEFQVDNIFHMGGDEVHFQCWNNSEEVTNWMGSRGWKTDDKGFLMLWNYFQEKAYSIVENILDNKTPNIILWTSHLTTGEALDKYLDKKKYIIQIWTKGDDPNVGELLDKGYRVIFSNYDALYLDCGFGGWVTDGNNWCSPYKTWQQIYMNNPEFLVANFTEAKRKQILGQSAALWTEQADDQTIDNRFWPRAAALAERTWTDPATDWHQAEYRMLHQRERLVKLGIAAEAIEPLWCNENEGFCPIRM